MFARPSFPWIVVLFFALVGPVNLPAAGVELKYPQLRRRKPGEPLLAGSLDCLRISPHRDSPIVAGRLNVGQPMDVLGVWEEAQGRLWLHVKLLGRKGWICV